MFAIAVLRRVRGGGAGSLEANERLKSEGVYSEAGSGRWSEVNSPKVALVVRRWLTALRYVLFEMVGRLGDHKPAIFNPGNVGGLPQRHKLQKSGRARRRATSRRRAQMPGVAPLPCPLVARCGAADALLFLAARGAECRILRSHGLLGG